MSAAPAVPGNGSSPTTDDSVAADSLLVSGLQAPAAPTAQEIVPHAGQANMLDAYVYNQFIAKGIVTWSTSQLAGTLLWSVPIHPDESNFALAYFARLYNCWAGGLQFKFKVAGTGFHAGALAIVRLPPNISPSDIATVEDLTAFEYEIIDPKTLEAQTRNLMDQRNIMYHYRPLDLNDRQTFGGYFALYVLMPLNTSSTGLNQINIQLFCRASPDFTVAQIRPLSIADRDPSNSFDAFSLLFGEFISGQFCGSDLDTVIFRSTAQPVANGYPLFGMWKGDYSPYTVDYAGYEHIPNAYIYPVATQDNGSGSSFAVVPASTSPISDFGETANMGFGITTAPHGAPMLSLASPTDLLALNYWSTVTVTNSIPFGPRANPSTMTGQPTVPASVGTAVLSQLFATPGIDIALAAANNYVSVAPPIAESIVVFTKRYNGQNTSLYYQFYQASQAFRHRKVPVITPGQCVLFQLTDNETNLPISYMKLHYEGYFTAPVRPTDLVLQYRNYLFIPIGYVLATDPFPTTPTMATNQMLVLLKNGELPLPNIAASAA